MKIQRTIPPVATPLTFSDLWNGFKGFFSCKRYLKRLETEIREYFGVKHVYLVSSGKAALYLILVSLKSLRPERNEVLIPAYTCFSVPSAIMKSGLDIALCDIESSSLDYDHTRFKGSINDNTLCVVPDHLFGIPADLDGIMKCVADKNIFIVEDAAQAMGVKCGGRLLGTIGDVGFFSLGRGKNITCGSGGIIVTDNDDIAEVIDKEYGLIRRPNIIKTLKDFIMVALMALFIRPWLYWLPAGMPFLRLGETVFHETFPIEGFSGMKAGLLKNWRSKLSHILKTREDNALQLSERLGINISKRGTIPCLRLPVFVNNMKTKIEMVESLSVRRLGISRMYPSAINEIENIRKQDPGKEYPNAVNVANSLITLPVHHLLSEGDIRKIADTVKGLVREM